MLPESNASLANSDRLVGISSFLSSFSETEKGQQDNHVQYNDQITTLGLVYASAVLWPLTQSQTVAYAAKQKKVQLDSWHL